MAQDRCYRQLYVCVGIRRASLFVYRCAQVEAGKSNREYRSDRLIRCHQSGLALSVLGY